MKLYDLLEQALNFSSSIIQELNEELYMMAMDGRPGRQADRQMEARMDVRMSAWI